LGILERTPRQRQPPIPYPVLVNVSVIIPTRAGDSVVLRRTLASLAAQTAPPQRVIVSLDDAAIPEPDLSVFDSARTRTFVVRGENAGPATARNRAFCHLDGGLVLFFNDDAAPAADCIENHIGAHLTDNAPKLVVGSAPWDFGRVPLRVIDRLVAETSLVFFYDQMTGKDPAHDWGYRHAWTLNLSLPHEALLPFDGRFDGPMFDDLEWAHRVTRDGIPVRYAPCARVEHAHRPCYTADRLLERETRVGHAAHALRAINPACFSDTFGDTGPPRFVERGATGDALERAREAFASFRLVAEEPGAGVDIAHLFDHCRIWRDAARAIGWSEAELGRSFSETASRVRTDLLPSGSIA